MFISLFEFPGVSAAAILSAGFLECVICAMKHRKRALEENSRLNSNKVVPIEDECPCYDIVTGLILCNIPQFTEVMPVSHGVVKIPDGFVLEHRDLIGRKVVLEPTDAKGRVFEVLLTTKIVDKIVGKHQSALSFGTGWREFRAESQVEEGDLLIFALVLSSHFVVYILRGHIEVAKRAMASYFTVPPPTSRSQFRKSSKPRRVVQEKPQEETPETEDNPVAEKNRHSYFVRRLHANAFAKGGKRTRTFEFPQAFLRSHATEVGDTVEFVVSSSRQVWPIETFSVSASNGTVRVFLSTGWLQFLEDNGLQQGDDIAIALVGHSKFLVTIVARASDKTCSE
ncbi:hypothetical protein KC19_2G240000 [Ceratodon purpureus]|uniref:TF-B3 domain-containing protein n=1 Tax=Ceratodon purpureus TaxID=3225 RepID=A0A8T0IXC6_CERPU|nr:hypothetical protein KC19_2G240000 [Ceratodon purpureus]